MTDESVQDKYPHWKDALLGNDGAVANLRCAVHYAFWHLVYGVLAVLAGIIFAVITIVSKLEPVLGPLGSKFASGISRLKGGAHSTLSSDRADDAIVAVMVIAVLFAIGQVALIAYNDPIMFLAGLGATTIILIALMVTIYLHDVYGEAVKARISNALSPITGAITSLFGKRKAAASTAKRTPVVRRVYGECPVSMDLAPKWFDSLLDDLFDEDA